MIFGGAKWSQVGTKLASKSDLKLKEPKSKETYKKHWILNELGCSNAANIDEQSIKND